MEDSIYKILADLVAFPVIGGYSNVSIAEYIMDFLSKNGIKYHLVPNEDNSKVSIHCQIGPEHPDGIILSGHMDVVPVEGQIWDTDPFILTAKGDLLYGRGTTDMKGFVASCLAMVPEMKQAALKRPIYLAFSYDEEVGCKAGPPLVADILKTYDPRPKYAIIGEPTLLHPYTGQKGICVFETVVNGSAGHSSRIREEVSAIHESSRLVLWLEEKMNDLVTNGQIDERFHPNHTSIHVGVINGGVAHNIVSDRCSFLWDVRCIPKDNLQEIFNSFEAFCRSRERELKGRFSEFSIKNRPWYIPVPALDTPETMSVVPLIQELTGIQELKTAAYATEAGQFAQGGFESVICGPGSIEQAHRANEFISKSQLQKGVAFLRRIIQFCSQ